MSKDVLKAMLDALSWEIEDCRRALDDCCAHENLKKEWSDKIFMECVIMSKRAEEAALKAYPKGRKGVLYDLARKSIVQGYEQAEKDLGWHSVKESLPPIDEEVIVLTDDIHGKIVPNSHRICYGHIVDKNIAVDYDGWNIPGITHWMYLPKLEEE